MESVGDAGGDVRAIELFGGQCSNCGYLFAPFQRFGCERCGAPCDELEKVELGKFGDVIASCVVHEHPDFPDMERCRVGRIRIRDSVAVTAFLDDDVADGEGVVGRIVDGLLVFCRVEE